MTEFFHMGGYAFYVWTSYAAVLVLFLWHFFSPLRRVKELLRELSLTVTDRDSTHRNEPR